ncbi:T9SS type A sorting domain-containing protein, partial [candidate division KSB1 bacterium]|nr:T9SS type A sorting domain-containing protein [candidate division KSB1 bacterium]
RISIHPDWYGDSVGEEWLFDNLRQDRELLVPPSNGLVLDFETVTPHLHWWDCGSMTADFWIEENPVKSDVNGSEKVGAFLTSDCGWEGFAIAEKWEPINTEKYSLVKIKVLPPEIGRNFMFKVELWENSGVMVETTIQTTKEDEWEEIYFDISGIQSRYYTKIAFFPDFQSTEEDNEWYIDQVRIVDPTDTYVDPDKVVKVFNVTAENYPNPFNPSTNIAFNVPLPSDVRVTIFDISGREIATIANGHHEPGRHEIFFDASGLASGVYFYKVETSYDVVVNKMMLMK